MISMMVGSVMLADAPFPEPLLALMVILVVVGELALLLAKGPPGAE